MPESYTFADLVDLNTIQGLLDQFYQLTRMPPSMTDEEGNLLFTVGLKTRGKDLHHGHPATRQQCFESDLTPTRQMNTTGDYACHEYPNGLVDLAVPVTIDGRHMANLFIGQFFMDAPPPRERLIRQAEESGFDKDAYLASLEEVSVFSRKEVELAAKFLSKLAQLLGEMALSNKRLASFNETLEQKVKRRTGQLRKASELRQQAFAELEAIFNNASVAIAHLKGNRVIYRINDEFERFSGYTREEVIGQTPFKAFGSPEEYDDFAGAVYPRLAKGETVSLEHRFIHKDGRTVWTFMHGKCLNPPRPEDGVIWFLTDITERKELETLKEDVERITRHDLKVPLNGIIGMCQSLLIDSNLTDEQREDIKLMEEAGFRMNNQIAQSLELYKIETGTYEFVPIPVNMGHGIRKSIRDLDHKASQKQVSFDVLINGTAGGHMAPLFAGADPMLSHTLFSNLVSNAVDAAPGGSTVTIDMKDEGDMIVVTVHNRGAVPEQIRDTFFDKYVTFGKTEGTGLGTYTAKLLAEAQNGHIVMETGEAHGTTVTVSLPTVKDE